MLVDLATYEIFEAIFAFDEGSCIEKKVGSGICELVAGFSACAAGSRASSGVQAAAGAAARLGRDLRRRLALAAAARLALDRQIHLGGHGRAAAAEGLADRILVETFGS